MSGRPFCGDCNGTMIVWRRLRGLGPDGAPIDDGEMHPTLCMSATCRMIRRYRL